MRAASNAGDTDDAHYQWDLLRGYIVLILKSLGIQNEAMPEYVESFSKFVAKQDFSKGEIDYESAVSLYRLILAPDDGLKQ